jgi:hypothetical protein
MEEWESSFAEKSARRHRKSRRRRIIRRSVVIAFVSAAIFLALWTFDNLTSNSPDLATGRVHGSR